MSEVATTRMSSKGQVVIPEAVRKTLGLKAGAQFVVVGEGDVVILKTITAPSLDAFDRVIGKAREAARRAGMTPADVDEAIKAARGG